MALVSSPAVAGRAAAIVGEGAVEPGSVSASAPVNTNFLDITYSAPSGVDAQVWAQAYAKGYIENRDDRSTARVRRRDPGHPRAARLAAEANCLRRMKTSRRSPVPLQRQQVQQKIDSLNQQIQFRTTELAQTPVPTQSPAQLIAAGDDPASARHHRTGSATCCSPRSPDSCSASGSPSSASSSTTA